MCKISATMNDEPHCAVRRGGCVPSPSIQHIGVGSAHVAEGPVKDPASRSRLRPWRRRTSGRVAPFIAICLVALSLRPAVASVSPYLEVIQRAAGLSSAEAGLLTTLPVLAFGACAPFAPKLARYFGLRTTLLGSLALLVVGIVVRSLPSTALLFVGTITAGVSIAFGNVLLPAWIKRHFASRLQLMTGVYSVALSGGAVLAAGFAVPLGRVSGLDWRFALSLWAIPPAAAFVAWACLRDRTGDVFPSGGVSRRMWRVPMAWQVTAFMGLQSFGFYSLLAWIPSIFEQRGVNIATAGWLLSLSGLAGVPTAFVAPLLASSARSQRALVAVTIVFGGLGMAGLSWHPVADAYLWMVLLGFGQGLGLGLALNFIVSRAANARQVAELSAMAQAAGYLLASIGPWLVGAMREWTGGWQIPLAVITVLLVPQLASGLAAARPLVIGTETV